MADKNNVIEWNPSTEFPDQLNEKQSHFSVDVLVYDHKSEEHTVAWYDFNEFRWLFLCREANFKTFKWRYFTDEHDRYKPKKIRK